MKHEFDTFELRALITQSCEIAIKRYRIENGEEKPFLKKSEAYRLYGRSTVERWLREGLIKPVKDGNATAMVRLDKIQLSILAKTSNRNTYLPKAERK